MDRDERHEDDTPETRPPDQSEAPPRVELHDPFKFDFEPTDGGEF